MAREIGRGDGVGGAVEGGGVGWEGGHAALVVGLEFLLHEICEEVGLETVVVRVVEGVDGHCWSRVVGFDLGFKVL